MVNVRGIELDKFVAPDIMFANATVNPYNEGFCTSDCLPSGLLNVSVCRQGEYLIHSFCFILFLFVGSVKLKKNINLYVGKMAHLDVMRHSLYVMLTQHS